VVLREARPRAGLDGDGLDAVARLGREREILHRLEGLDCVPRLLGHCVAWEHHFLVEEYIEGETLLEAILTRHPLVHPVPAENDLGKYVAWATDVLTAIQAALEAVHAHGVRFGDLHPGNVMLRSDGRVALIDFELASDLNDDSARTLGAPGFLAPIDMSGADADRYAMECLRPMRIASAWF
jgi:serine/threonine protein kinase